MTRQCVPVGAHCARGGPKAPPAGAAAAASPTAAPASDRAALDEPYPEPHLALAKLVLVAAVMAKLNVERVEYHETNGSCLGVLLHEPFWE